MTSSAQTTPVDEYIAEHGVEITAACRRIHGRVRRTPLLETDLGPGLLIKAENLQVTGSFKARGAFNAMLSLLERDPAQHVVCTVSSGNHAQAVAYAARELGLRAVIVIPQGANPHKVAATRELGAEVVSDEVTFDNRERIARDLAARERFPLVHPFDDWDVIHGQGTAAREILDHSSEVAAIVVPVGGGGLLSGTALAVRNARPDVRVFGVEPEVADDAARSYRSGARQSLDRSPATIADGVKVLAIGERCFDVIVRRRLVDDVVTVSEAEIREATRLAWLRGHLLLEPTAALPIAAWMTGRVPRGTPAQPTAIIASGGNIDPAVVAEILG